MLTFRGVEESKTFFSKSRHEVIIKKADIYGGRVVFGLVKQR